MNTTALQNAPSPSAPAERGLDDVGGLSTLNRFFAGARFAASGVSFTFRHPELLVWTLVPMLIQLVIFVGVVGYGLSAVGGLVDRFGPEPGQWYSFLGAVLGLAFGALAILGGALAALLLGSVVCDPFYDVISEKTESLHLGRDVGTPFSVGSVVSGIARELFVTCLRFAIWASVALPLWLFSLTGLGSVVAVPLGLLWTWLFVAFEFLARSQARHALDARARFSALFGHKAVAAGFGGLGWLMSYVPLTAPFLVVGGTRLHLALVAYDRVKNNLSDDDKRRLRGAA